MNTLLPSTDTHGRDLITLTHKGAKITLSLYGAHILSWTTPTHGELLYLSPQALYADGKAIRGGIPLCWPWFGKAGTPAHGYARTNLWQLNASDLDNPDYASLSLILPASNDDIPTATLTLTLKESSLELSLETLAGKTPVELSVAFHNYFALSSIENAKVLGLAHTPYTDYVDTPSHNDDLDLRPHPPIDRIYQEVHTRPLELLDPARQLTLRIQTNSAPSCVVWNPGPDHGIGDLPPDAWKHFICIESALITPHARLLLPGEAHTLRQTLTLL